MVVAEGVSFGARLRQLREQAGLTQEALAERARLSTDAVAALERGRRTAPRLSTIALLAAALKLDQPARAGLLAAARGADEGPPVTVPQADAPSLPIPPTALVGRERAVAEAAELLRRAVAPVRLLTLIGLGGVGKTRLALAIAEAVQGEYADGVAFVDLAPLHDYRLVPATVARTVGVWEREGQSARDLLLAQLRDRRMLLILDNFEHVLDAAPLVTDLLAACPRLALLVTSQVALRLRAEHRLRVPTLSTPTADQAARLDVIAAAPAVRLFVDRARAVAPGFALTADNAPAVAELCRRLDGLPLAIELAAARVALLPPAALLARLGRRLALLADGPRDAPSRQRTLRAALEWSYGLLPPEEQEIFRRLAVFAADWSLDAAAAISAPDAGADILSGVASLLEQGLIREEASPYGEPRFRMLEMVREFAAERLADSGETTLVRRRHAAYFLALAEAVEPQLNSAGRPVALARLGADQENMRAALAWSVGEGEDPGLGLRLVAALWLSWYYRGQVSEGRAWLEQALAKGARASRDAARGRVLLGLGTLAWIQGDFAAAETALDESLAISREYGAPRSAARALTTLGLVRTSQGDSTAALAGYREGLALARAVGDRWWQAFTLGFVGDAALLSGDPVGARTSYEESLALYRELRDAWGGIQPLIGLGSVAAAQHDDAVAHARYAEALAIARQTEDKASTTHALVELGGAAMRLGDVTGATAAFVEGVALAREVGTLIGLAFALAGLAEVALRQGQPERAVRLLAAVPGALTVARAGIRSLDRAAFDRAVAAARAQLDEATYATAWAAGQAMTPEQASDYAAAPDAAASGE